MPTPKKGEGKSEYMSRCIPQVIEEGTVDSDKSGSAKRDQAAAICSSMYDRHQEKKTGRKKLEKQ